MTGTKRGVVLFLVGAVLLSAVAPAGAQQIPTPQAKYLALSPDGRAGYILGMYEGFLVSGMAVCESLAVDKIQSLTEGLLKRPEKEIRALAMPNLILTAMMNNGCRRGSGFPPNAPPAR
jgi:hypothetical protein